MFADVFFLQKANEETIDAELTRLRKALDQAEAEAQRTDANLANEAFVSGHPQP